MKSLPKEKSKKKWLIKASQPTSFFVQFSNNLFHPENKDLLETGKTGKGARRLVIVDEYVHDNYGKTIQNYFSKNGITCSILTLKSEEIKKNWEETVRILKAMEDFKLERQNEPVIAVGGGILLDIAGFAANLYRRGVPYIRVPTTLLALVDASVGVKTGINHFDRRNRLGSYYAPVGSYLDKSFLTTLSEKDFSNGCGEILKMAVIKDAHLFSLLEKHGKKLIRTKFQKGDESQEVIHRSIQGMIEELEPNLWENDMRRLVNFGHSFGPMIEMRALPHLLHGEAVGLDVLFSCILSAQRGIMKWTEVERIYATMKILGLPTFHPLFNDQAILEEGLADTTRHRNSAQELPIPVAIGRAIFVNDMTSDEIKKASRIMKKKFSV